MYANLCEKGAIKDDIVVEGYIKYGRTIRASLDLVIGELRPGGREEAMS